MLDYWERQTEPLYPDLEWNFPEQKLNSVVVVGGNIQSFSAVVKTSEYFSNTFPIKKVKTVLPEALREKIPLLLDYAPSTKSGSFDKSAALNAFFSSSDFNLLIGDLSKNSITATAFEQAIKSSDKPVILARDSVDLLAPIIDGIIEHQNLIIVASVLQLQKVFRSLYYPKMLLLSQPLVPVVETLHKFTLSYPVTIVTLHQEQIIVASSGKIATTLLEKTAFTPVSIWNGVLASNIMAFNLWNPGKMFEATTAAILKR